ncbi:MaoC/PaaZ C-terminal domain-containing protein [Janibacter alkaliphilus]|uniref:Acyl dehydratase n=1 Tax=Janibacter alkaliphilus TaxID=1069963 RepID=A0A852X6F4_9MICO|nr:MaoC/PaaZ C-terminal domain-containing protein [Janibacter alkaliphilus]NYG38018.1 acyl dehydratase [Janibacter alkaliphilus]
MAVETLTSVPSLGPVLARGALAGSSSGSTLPDVALRVTPAIDRADLLEYQRLCGFEGGDVLPHTYPHIVSFPLQMTLMARRDFPLSMAGLVHVENEIEVLRRLTADDALEITVSADRLVGHPRGRVVEMVTQARVDGELVWQGRSSYLSRGKGDPEAERSQPPATPKGLPAQQWRLPSGFGRRYAAVTGDVNPIHMSNVTAKAMGFPRAIAHGMWTYARTLAALGPQTSEPGTSHVWFKKPLLLPGVVDLVVQQPETEGGQVLAGLRGARKKDTEHLVLTFDPA